MFRLLIPVIGVLLALGMLTLPGCSSAENGGTVGMVGTSGPTAAGPYDQCPWFREVWQDDQGLTGTGAKVDCDGIRGYSESGYGGDGGLRGIGYEPSD